MGPVLFLDNSLIRQKPRPTPGMRESPPPTDRRRQRDLRILARMICVYCRDHHASAEKTQAYCKGHDFERITGSGVEVCPDCAKLLTHALVKRSTCPLVPKPACKHCPQHCYHPTYRQQIREVMKYSGRKLVLAGRIDFLFHLLF
jgi:predicted amidophosphoribosyltransferase